MRELLKTLREVFATAPQNGGQPTSSLHEGGNIGGRARPYIQRQPENLSYKDLNRLLPFVRPHWRLGVIASVLAIVSAVVVILIPLLFKSLTDDAVLKGNHQLLNGIIGFLIGALVIFTLADFLKQIYFFRFQQEIVFGIQSTLIDKLLRLPKAFFDANSTGYIMSRGIGDSFQLEAFFSLKLIDILTNSLQLVFSLAVLLYLDWKLTLLSLVVLPFFIAVTRVIKSRARRLSRTALEKTSLVSRDLEESLSGAALIKSFAAEEKETEKLLVSLRESFKANQNRATIMAFFTFLSGMVNAVGMGAVLWFGASQVVKKELTAGELLAFSVYLGFLIKPATFLAGININFQLAFAALERVFEVLNLVSEAESREKKNKVSRLDGRVRFDDVAFSYDGRRTVLENISFDVEPGQLVSIVGPSGAGKSTLVNLILGLYRPLTGKIYYDELASEEINLQSLRERLAVVSQEIFLFNESVVENIRYGRPDASNEEVFAAARLAGAHEFISQLLEGYETKVGGKGVKLSVGQKQRLSIARAILRNPDILILDEATSALDPLTEQAVHLMLQDFCRGRTVFIIAHHLSTVRMSDLILALDHGTIVQRGTHQELFDEEGLYRQLCLTQFFHADQAA